MEHTANYVTIEFTSSLDEAATNESWGIRDFSIWRDGGVPKPFGDVPPGFNPTEWVHVSDEFTSEELDENMLGGWLLEGNNGIISDCAGTKLIGGYGNFGAGAKMSKTFTELGSHSKIKIQV